MKNIYYTISSIHITLYVSTFYYILYHILHYVKYPLLVYFNNLQIELLQPIQPHYTSMLDL